MRVSIFSYRPTIMKYQSLEEFLAYVEQRNPGQPEYLQAVSEVMESLWPFISANKRYAEHSLLDRLIEPERVRTCPVLSRACTSKGAGDSSPTCAASGSWLVSSISA